MNRDQGSKRWINPLLTQLKLAQKKETGPDPNRPWKQIEVSHLTDRVGRIASEINETAGYHLLETLYYLPPQKTALCVRFDHNRDKHSMEILVRGDEIALKFSASKHATFGWQRFFLSDPLSSKSVVTWEQPIRPEEILDEHIQGWLTYLLSGMSKEFRPDVLNSASAESDLTAVLRKASA